MTKLNWTPKKRGDIYCSPACGAGCKHEWFLKAVKNAEWLCKQLPGFKPYVHENMGWFWKAKNGNITISPEVYIPHGRRSKRHGYFASFEGEGVVSSGKTPMDALVNMYKYFAGRVVINANKRDEIYRAIQEAK